MNKYKIVSSLTLTTGLVLDSVASVISAKCSLLRRERQAELCMITNNTLTMCYRFAHRSRCQSRHMPALYGGMCRLATVGDIARQASQGSTSKEDPGVSLVTTKDHLRPSIEHTPGPHFSKRHFLANTPGTFESLILNRIPT